MTATLIQRAYWTKMVEGGCLICQRPACVAHFHGGSITPILGVKAKGKKLRRMDWICGPLCPDHHTELDNGVRSWEEKYGTQASHIDALCERFGLDLWTLARG